MWDSGREMYKIEMALYEKKNSVTLTSLEDHENSESNFLFLDVEFSAYIRPGVAIKLLLCDHEVMGSSPRNSLLQKCGESRGDDAA
jgi:hypothetical protein